MAELFGDLRGDRGIQKEVGNTAKTNATSAASAKTGNQTFQPATNHNTTPFYGVDIFGNTIIYAGENKKYSESQANQEAIIENRARSKGLVGSASVSLDKDSGNIKVSAPKGVLESNAGQRLINNDTLKSLSQAYKLNENYQLSYTEFDKDGNEVKVTVSVPEYVDKLDEAIKNLAENSKYADRVRYSYTKELGDNAEKFTDDQIRMSLDYQGSVIPIPEFASHSMWLKSIENLVDNGYIKTDDLKAAYNRSNLGREEMAALLGMINVRLKYDKWGDEDYYEDEEGNLVLDRNSVNEMAKALALRNYILANDPDSTWLQSVGDNIETLSLNALYGFNRVFDNIANVGETIITLGQGQFMQNYIKDMDEAISGYNAESLLVNDATAVTSILGQIGGTIAGTFASAWLGGEVVGGLGKAASAVTGKALTTAAESVGLAGKTATVKNIIDLAKNAENISTGTRVMLQIANAAQKAQIATNVAKAFLSSHKVANFVVDFLLDTVHDALLYDSTTLREALQSSDQETRDYWLGQLADNAKWWGGMAGAKTLVKWAGKTEIGKAANIMFTRLINKIAAATGGKWADIKDSAAGGSVMKKLEDQYRKAVADNDMRKANRVANKITQELQNNVLRDARKSLANADLEWDGLKLTEKSQEEWNNLLTRVKAWENSIDSYQRNISWKRQEMVGKVRDPATGKVNFINPELGGANETTSSAYLDIANALAKHNIRPDADGLWNQSASNYFGSLYDLSFAKATAAQEGPNAVKAQNAIPIYEANVAAARAELPDDVADMIEKLVLKDKTYQNFYTQLNAYGVAKQTVDINRIQSLESNPIYKDTGYVPSVVEHQTTGHYVSDSGRIDAVLEQDIEKRTFNAQLGQNYMDPELVRQTRISTMARAEVNKDLLKSYAGYGSDATNITKISGAETEYARKVTESKDLLESAISLNAAKVIKEKPQFKIIKNKRRKPVKNKTINQSYVEEAVSSLSLSDTTKILTDKNILSSSKRKLTDGITRANYDEWYNAQNKSVKKYLNQQYSRMSGAGERGYDAMQSCMKAGGQDFEAGLQRAYLMGDANFAKSSTMNEAARNIENGKDAFYDGVVKARAKGSLKNVTYIKADELVDDLDKTIRDSIDAMVQNTLDDENAKVALNALSEGADGAAETGRYIALRQLSSEQNKKLAYASIDEAIDKEQAGKKITQDDVNNIKKQAHYMYDATLANELNNAANVVKTINPSLVDSKSIYDKARSLNDEIMGLKNSMDPDASSASGTIMYIDDQGRQAFAQVDPAFASLYNYRFKMTKAEAGVFAKVNAKMSQLFRLGTTSVNLTSFGNQMFRDFGNAVLVGGAWQTIKTNADNLVDVFGQNIVDQIKRFDPTGYEMRQVSKIAEQTGQTIEQAAVSRELMRGAAIAPTTTEQTLYRTFMKQAYGGNSDSMLDNMKNTLQDMIDKVVGKPDELLNGKRENYLRNRVYASTLNDAMESGYTFEQARVAAEFTMNNATTNFSRQLYHMQAIADSTPYFRAAINGTKSFWRMWSLDPVGITGRIMGGLILPTIYLTGSSLANKEDAELYNNIPEYAKSENLVFVHNGSVVTIPIPQELVAIVDPFRQFTEYLAGANREDFLDLLANDILGFSPVDLTGFTTVDVDRVINDPTLLDRVSRGTSRVFSQLAPVPVKTMYMLATRTDPYTGKSLTDPAYSYWNEETSSVESMDYTQNAFARWFGRLFGDNMSPYLAERIVSGVVGSTGLNILGDLTALLQEGPEAAVASAGTNIAGQISKPFYTDAYSIADAAWNRAVRQLTAEKNAITQDEEYKVILNRLSQEKDPQKRKELSAQLQNMVNEYQQKVGDTVQRISTKYNGTFDRKKFAAVIQLLNFNTDPLYQTSTQYSSDVASSGFYSGRNAAVETMQRLGVVGTEDMSVFGYLTVDKDGNIVVRYNEPVAIMEAKNVWNSQNDIHLANIKAIVSQADLWDRKDAVDAQVQAIYDKDTLTNADYNAINSIYINWNAEVMGALAPYIEQMTPEAAINNSSVLDYLDGLIEIPSEFKKDSYGRYVTNKKLGEGSANKAYAQNYIRKIFKVNDSGHIGGINYSGRK